MAFIAMGVLTMLLNVTSSWGVLIFFCLALGFADGCFWCAEGPIAYDLVGTAGAAQALGFMKGVMGVSFATGPPIAGGRGKKPSIGRDATNKSGRQSGSSVGIHTLHTSLYIHVWHLIVRSGSTY